jgi:hypothetical protein
VLEISNRKDVEEIVRETHKKSASSEFNFFQNRFAGFCFGFPWREVGGEDNSM